MQIDLSHADQHSKQAWLDHQLGSQVGLTYRIVRHLASGGMGHVYLAEDIETGAYAAVKLATPDDHIPSELLAHEAAVLSRFSHPSVVRFIESGRTLEGADYLLLEYVRGLDLDDWMVESKTLLSYTELLDAVTQLASAIDYLHAHDIVHSDVKPANVMIDRGAKPAIKLVDFGLAFDRRAWSPRRGSAGTPGYMAPEQLRGERCGPAIDRFALAALSFELLTGRALQPWPTLSRLRMRAWARSNPLQHRELLSPALQRVFSRALHDSPEARFPSAAAFVEALAEGFERETTPSFVRSVAYADTILADAAVDH